MTDIYGKHIARCNEAMQRSPEGLARGLLFVMATIQQQLETTPDILTDFCEYGQDASFAFGFKKRAVAWIQNKDNIATLYAALETVRHAKSLGIMDQGAVDVAYLRLLTKVPGLGLVKAGFAAQLYDNAVGCLDTHNIKLYDIPLNTLRLDKTATEPTQIRKIKDYADRCAALGGSETLWAAWCQYKAAMRPQNWRDGAVSVSRLHAELVCDTVHVSECFPESEQQDLDYYPRFAKDRED